MCVTVLIDVYITIKTYRNIIYTIIIHYDVDYILFVFSYQVHVDLLCIIIDNRQQCCNDF